ncbi:hypothetical protein KY290_027240 [Solanum tuberosum]|uniref:Reverse transcriptase zinc-binding domain-containing protein n=1 Tax=Solanum tuberosum TaxID=4113 RepID=A0ABQ7UEI9_SOLTU|nr:hypothetical protein KY290_027240 [Solanum tuberosum]
MEARIIVEKLHIVVQPGRSLTRSMYLQLLGELPQVIWKGLIFQNQARPKATFTLWLCLHGKMLTTERLNKWGMNVDPTCVLCRSYFEDKDHLFTECSYGNQVWNRLLNWIGQPFITPQSWTQHLEWSLTHGKGKSAQARIFRMLNAEIVHAIWNERNTRIS